MIPRLRIGPFLLATALIVVLGWPSLAILLEGSGIRETAPSGSGGLMSPSVSSGFGERSWKGTTSLVRNTVGLVLAVEAMALPVGIVLAILLFRTDVWGRRGLLSLLATAVFVPLPLLALAWLGSFGNLGRSQAFGLPPILVGWFGAAFVHAAAAVPWVVFLVGVGLRNVEPELEEAALLDLPSWSVLVRVTLRRSLGAIAAAALAVAVLTAGDMTVTDLIPVRVYAEEVYTRYQTGDGAGASAVALPPLFVLGTLVLIVCRALLRTDPSRLPSAASRPRIWRLGAARWSVGVPLTILAGSALALPILGLFWRAGRIGGRAAVGLGPRWSFAGLFETLAMAWVDVAGPSWRDSPMLKSAFWASLGATVATVMAWALAWESRRRGPWRWAAAATIALALAAPGPVVGMALVLAYRDVPPIYDTTVILVLAYVARTLPYALLVLWPEVRRIPQAFLEGAALEGYGPWGIARRVAIPSTRDALAAAWGVAFVLSLGELPATNLVEPPGTTTLAKLIWILLHTGVESHLAGVGLIVIAAVAAVGLPVAWGVGRLYEPDRASRIPKDFGEEAEYR